MCEKVTLFDIESMSNIDSTYTTKVGIPQYQPTGEIPSIFELCDVRKYEQFIQEISGANITEEEKQFLKFAASRHIVFNYAKIAEYYCNSSKEMQALMEKSALVLIDINDAIANGYVKLDHALTDMAEKAYKKRVELKGR